MRAGVFFRPYYLLLGLLAGYGVATVALAELPAVGQFDLEVYDDGYFSLFANDAPLVQILEEVSEVTGIPIVYDPSDPATITVSMTDRDIEEVVKGIASGSVITYAEDPATGEYYIESIATTMAVGYATRQKQIRQQVVQSRKLDERLKTHTDRPLRYSGIGARIELSNEGDGVWVRPISDHAPAAKSGLRVGDKVVAIDGKAVSGFENLRDISTAIRGPVGSVVALTVRQPDGTEELRQVKREFYRYDPPRKTP